VLLDMDGVLYEGERLIEGAVEALHWIRAQGLPHLLLTNTSSRPRSALVAKLAGLGIDVSADEILTPAVAAGDWIRSEGVGPVALFCEASTAEDLGQVEVLAADAESGAGAVLVGDLGARWDFATLNRAFRLLMASERPRLLALGMTRYWRAEDGLRLDTAPFVAALEHAAGIEAVVLGKPSPLFFAAALARLDVAAGEAVMVGDDVRTDVGGAQAAGLQGVLVRTGKFREADLDGDVRPDAVIDSLADFPGWFRAR
ncbi:MAG TPA: TIGR01458 family HAD-type hydrolase, partial [Pseudomonadales bacterium]|nr:TIGR01458 family HAD-type hydrolase [Pseudomonadales bacterium]